MLKKVLAISSELTIRDSILYCLGIGFSKEQLNYKDLEFTYELDEHFKAFPTVATCFHKMDIFGSLRACPGLPKFHAMSVLHGEHRLEIFKKIYPEMRIETTGSIASIENKGKNAFINLEFNSYEIDHKQKKELAFVNTMGLVIRGLGGFSQTTSVQNKQLASIQKYPQTQPDKVINETTNSNQAILYRLNGDQNPLHIDPHLISMAHFEKPILHGLCTYGIATKIVMQQYCDNNPNLIKNINCRFASHVFPGETLEFKLWKKDKTVFVSGSVIERKKECIYGTVGLSSIPI